MKISIYHGNLKTTYTLAPASIAQGNSGKTGYEIIRIRLPANSLGNSVSKNIFISNIETLTLCCGTMVLYTERSCEVILDTEKQSYA